MTNLTDFNGCGIIVAGNDEFGTLNCGDERGHFDIETGNWIRDGLWSCPTCKAKIKAKAEISMRIF